jgi:hypothetical protein
LTERGKQAACNSASGVTNWSRSTETTTLGFLLDAERFFGHAFCIAAVTPNFAQSFAACSRW